MRIQDALSTTVLALAFLAPCATAAGSGPEGSGVSASLPAAPTDSVRTAGDDRESSAEAVAERIGNALKRINPQARVDHVGPALAPGYYEVIAGGEIFYVSQDGRYLFQGLYDLKDGRDASQFGAMPGLRLRALRTIPHSERIVFPATGATKHTVVVFTDVECGFCQKFHQEIEQYNKLGITIEYLAFPRAGMDSDDARKMQAVWCSSDRKKALTDAKAGIDVTAPACDDPVGRQHDIGLQIGLRGTPMIVDAMGVAFPGYLPPEALLSELDRLQALRANP
jgi:thiol:disulfide interchange protein DsbC